MNQTLHRRPEATLTPPRPAAIFGRTLRSIAIVLLCALGLPAALPSTLSAATVTQTIDGLQYTIDTTAKTASVKQADTSLTSASILSSVTYQNVAYPVTKVEDEGFMSSQIAEVFLPQSLTTIGEKAFYGCQKLTELTVPENITSIGINGFYNCRRLTKVNWNAIKCKNPYGEKWGLFYNKIEEISFGPKVKTVPNFLCYNQSGIKYIPTDNFIEEIEEYAFASCTGLTEVTLPASVKTIGYLAFSDCINLTKLTLNDGLEVIGWAIIANCENLEELTIPESVKIIEYSIIWNCPKLTTVYFNAPGPFNNNPFRLAGLAPDGIVYDMNSNIQEIYCGEKVTVIPRGIFSHLPHLKRFHAQSYTEIGALAFYQDESLEDFVFPSTIKSIGTSAFYECKSLTRIHIPKSVTNLGDHQSGAAFASCTGLKAIKVESSMIGAGSFRGCTNLEKACLNTNQLWDNVFAGCDKIHTIYSLTELPPLAESNTFSKYDGVTVYVPVGALEEYRKDDIWKNFTDIRESDFTDLDKLLWGDDEPDPKPDPLPDTITLDDITYSLNHDTKTATVTTAAITITSAIIPDTLDIKGSVYTVTEIGDAAFKECIDLRTIKLTDNLESIGYEAFRGCSNLESIAIPEKVTKIKDVTFDSCSNLKKVDLPAGITVIGTCAFQFCYELQEIEIPASCRLIGNGAFGGCRSLSKVYIPSTVNWVDAFAFDLCESLKYVWIEADTIGFGAFGANDSLEKICLKTYSIEKTAFNNLPKLRKIYSLNSTPPEIVSETFNSYEGVTLFVPVGAGEAYRNAEFWKNFTDIRESDFANLEETFWKDDEEDPDPKPDPKPETVTVDGVVYSLNHDAKTAIATGMVGEVMDMTIHGSVDVEGEDYAVTAIKDEAFADSGIETLVIDEGVETVGKMAFRDCSKLTSVKFPASISAIGDNAFLNCESIAAVNIADVRKWAQIDFQSDFGSAACNPMGYAGTFTVGDSSEPLTQLVLDDIEYVSQYAFFGANNLKTIKITGNTKIGKYVFANLQGVEALCLEISEIGEGNFISSRIPKVYSLTATPPAAKDAFYYWGGGDYLYVPKGSVEAYRNAEVWKDFSEIVESDFTGLDEIFDPDYTPSQTEPIEDVWIGDYKYTLYPDTQTATVTGYNKEPVHVVIPEQINFSGLYYVVNKIANNTFWRGTMESVELPESILEVGTWAFYMCNNLSELTIGENMKLLGGGIIDDCKNFTTLNYNAISCDQVGNINPFGGANIHILNIGDKVKRLPRTFFRSIPIENLVIPDCVEELSSGAFYECENLKSVTIGANVKEIPGTFITCPAIEKVTFNAINCADCTATPFPTTVKEISFGDKVERIPAYLCNEWTEIGNVELPQSLKEIGRYAFQNVQGITEVTIPENVTAVHDMAFMNCLNLRKLTYNAIDCPEIGEEMYVFNRSVTDLTIGEKVTRIPAWGFIEQPIEKVVIPDAVTEIGNNAFYGCKELKDLTIGKGVMKIAQSAFNGATNISRLQFNAIECEDLYYLNEDETEIFSRGFYPNITEAYIGDEVRRIPACLLALNDGLLEIEIPASVEEIGIFAFTECNNIKNVIINDLNHWAQTNLLSSGSNPIRYSHSFVLKDSEDPIKHLNITGVPEIGNGVFYSAQNLTTVRITDCKKIGFNAFIYASNISDICLEVNEVGDYCFEVSKPGMNVYSLTQTPPAAGEGAFYIMDEALTLKDVNLYVPVGCKDLYVADPFWGQMNVMESEMTDLDSIFDPENHNVGVSTIFDTDEAVYFTLDGLRVDAERLAPGTYIRIANGKSTKILVK